jgi:hypothetical protein
MTAPLSGTYSISKHTEIQITVKPGYNDIGLYETSPIESDILWYQLILHC